MTTTDREGKCVDPTHEAGQPPSHDIDHLPPVLSVDEVAKLLRLGRKATYAAVARGEVAGVIRLGRSIRVSRDALARQLAGRDAVGR
jgi:excisionase family DNA binding protein